MTTGGGWQDQIGGLYGGFKLGVSRAKLPCRIDCYKVPVEKTFVQTVNKHLILCYTGQVRLAKNLLQSVVRSWYSGDEALFDTFSRLRVCAVKAAEAVSQGSLTGLGNKINEYWSIKKTVAPGSEPAKVTKLLEQLSPELLGASLAGAGGGGYLYALLKEPSEGKNIYITKSQQKSKNNNRSQQKSLETSPKQCKVSLKHLLNSYSLCH